MPTYRPVPVDDRDRFEEILQHAFAVEQGPDVDRPGEPDESDEEWPPTLSDPRGVFDGERLVSVCKLYTLDAYVHDGFVRIGGLGGVATPPQHRRNGHVRTLAAGALEEYREAGVALVALWPFDTGFYRHLGWGIANKYTSYEVPPDQLSFARGASGEIRRLSPDDWERLRPVEVAFGEGTTLSLRRSEEWWRERTLGAWPGDVAPYVYGYERDGDLCGYVLYTVDGGEDGPRLTVQSLAHTDPEAYRALLGFLSDHDSQVKTIVLRRAEETTLLDMVPDPDRVECTVTTGPMVRLTDVEDALDGYPWPDGLDCRFTLEVTDPLLDSNDGLFDVVVEGGSATVHPLAGPETGTDGGRTGNNATDAEVDARADVATLSQLYVGAYDAADAERFGEFAVHRESLREPLAESFPDRRVCLREFF